MKLFHSKKKFVFALQRDWRDFATLQVLYSLIDLLFSYTCIVGYIPGFSTHYNIIVFAAE